MTVAEPRPGDGPVRIMLRVVIRPGAGPDFERAWTRLAAQIAENPANLGQSLARSRSETDVYYVTSDWVDAERFRAFERSARHVENRRRLAPYRVDSTMWTMRVVHALPGPGVTG
ncbi:antibiotic biosynthesis monooxygenase family protein [Wenjunlia tyrosinilytica]|uniref:Antibiotic biosynthesis monooxygenase n=1 Tax=Wenjunlia tyrosinilytica TaxID=1544741 RepID=A0A917ZVC2_9ACTN|nr:antibiotic biosynthesis monooxygenase family protein [Wenjunlia tyrosinilytica]GGO97265.1 antibiotic biosynthesis monooxygenase [Wenjunlia tyrosinilytica]